MGNERFSEAIGSESYVEIMDVFLQRLQEQTEKVRAFQAERAMPVTVLGREYCLPCSDESLEGKLVIIRPASPCAGVSHCGLPARICAGWFWLFSQLPRTRNLF